MPRVKDSPPVHLGPGELDRLKRAAKKGIETAQQNQDHQRELVRKMKQRINELCEAHIPVAEAIKRACQEVAELLFQIVNVSNTEEDKDDDWREPTDAQLRRVPRIRPE